MTVHPRLVRSVPFWTLIVGSAAAIGGGAYLLVDKLGTMETALTANTATGVDVYVGQVWAVFGGVLVGAGVLGLALALAVAAARSLVPVHVDEIDWTDAAAETATETETTAYAAAPVAAGSDAADDRTPATEATPAEAAAAPSADDHDEPAVVTTPDPESTHR